MILAVGVNNVVLEQSRCFSQRIVALSSMQIFRYSWHWTSTAVSRNLMYFCMSSKDLQNRSRSRSLKMRFISSLTSKIRGSERLKNPWRIFNSGSCSWSSLVISMKCERRKAPMLLEKVCSSCSSSVNAARFNWIIWSDGSLSIDLLLRKITGRAESKIVLKYCRRLIRISGGEEEREIQIVLFYQSPRRNRLELLESVRNLWLQDIQRLTPLTLTCLSRGTLLYREWVLFSISLSVSRSFAFWNKLLYFQMDQSCCSKRSITLQVRYLKSIALSHNH